MNLDTLVKKGTRPWRSSPAVRSVDIWHEYDVPMTGIMEFEQGTALFTAIGDTDSRLSVWAYTWLSEDETNRLPAEVGSVQELCGLVDRIFEGRDAVLALADDLVIQQWSPAKVESGLLDTASSFLGQILQVIESRRAPGDRFNARLAEVEAATRELIGA